MELRQLADDDLCSSLKLGSAELQPLKAYLRHNSKRYHKQNLARTFVVTEDGQKQVIAYATILCTQIRVDQVGGVDLAEGHFPYQDYPAIRLARLAVDSRQQGKGLGGTLVDFILSLARDHIMPFAGCRFLILDAKPGSVSFYRKKGFSEIGAIPDDGNPLTLMFVDLHKLGSN